MMTFKLNTICLLAWVLFPLMSSFAFAQDLAKQNEYYTITKVPVPPGVVLELGAMETMPDGRLAVSSRRGDIYMFSNPLQKDASKIEAKMFAQGLHEVLGLAYRDGSLYATQRGEVTRLTDTEEDGTADLFETVTDGWGIDGDYHEYAFGSKFDKDGNLWVTLCLTGSFSSKNKYRGWCLRVSPDGKITPHLQRASLARRRGIQCRWRVFLYRQSRPLERDMWAEVVASGFVSGTSGWKPMVSGAIG